MEDQYKKLMDMLSIVVARLDRLDELADTIAEMEQRHVQYGVRPGQYKISWSCFTMDIGTGAGQ